MIAPVIFTSARAEFLKNQACEMFAGAAAIRDENHRRSLFYRMMFIHFASKPQQLPRSQ
jgi:hypothetical protein